LSKMPGNLLLDLYGTNNYKREKITDEPAFYG